MAKDYTRLYFAQEDLKVVNFLHVRQFYIVYCFREEKEKKMS